MQHNPHKRTKMTKDERIAASMKALRRWELDDQIPQREPEYHVALRSDEHGLSLGNGCYWKLGRR